MLSLSVQRISAAAPAVVVGLSSLVFWRPAVDVFNTAKATVLVLGVLSITAAGIGRGWSAGRITLPWGPWPVAAMLLIGTMAARVVLTATRGGDWAGQVVGAPGRMGGLGLYVAVVVLALVVARVGTSARRDMVWVLIATAAVVCAYALVQAAGGDPLAWVAVEGGVPVFSTFGNVDFASAWIGIVSLLAVGVAVDRSIGRPWRIVAGWVAVAGLVAAVLTGSLQGPVILGGGGLVIALGLWVDRGTGSAVHRAAALLAGAVVVVVGVMALGTVDGAARSLETRVPKWTAALHIAGEDPVFGRGLDTYGDWYFAARGADVARELGFGRSVDNAHSVALHLLSGGGVPVLVAWLATVVVLPGRAVLRSWRLVRQRPIDLAIVAAWLGYLVGSAVSIDVPPLAGLGLLLTGLVMSATASVRGRAIAVPAIDPAPARVIVAVAALVLVAPISRPMRAEVVAWDAEVARVTGDVITAGELTARAAKLASWDGRPDAAQGRWLTALGRLPAAVEHHRHALERDPRNLSHALNVARLEARLGHDDLAAAAYERVQQIDPHTPALQREVADFRSGLGGERSPSADTTTAGQPEGATIGAPPRSP